MIRLSLDGGRILYTMTKDTLQVTGAVKDFLEKKLLEEKTIKGGKKRLADLLRTTSDLQIVTLETKDIHFFEKLAKHYGIRYHLSKSEQKGKIDCLFPAQDIRRVNHVLEKMRFPVAKPLRSYAKERGARKREQTKEREPCR